MSALLVDNGRDQMPDFVRHGRNEKILEVRRPEGGIEAKELGGGDSVCPSGIRLPSAGAAQVEVDSRESMGDHGGPLGLSERPEAAAFGYDGVDLGEGHGAFLSVDATMGEVGEDCKHFLREKIGRV